MEHFFISYPDFKLGDIIDPDEANTNNADITFKFNEIVDALNSLYSDSATGEPSIIKIRGNVVQIRPISSFGSTNVEDFLNELINLLESPGGASYIGSETISGLDGRNVFTQINEFYDKFVDLRDNTYTKGAIDSMFEPVEEIINEKGELMVLGRIEVRARDPQDPEVGRIWIIHDED